MIKDIGDRKILLIFSLVALQIFSSINVYFANYFLLNTVPGLFPSNYILPNFLICWRIISSIGRISGAFVIGKYASKYKFSKVINLVSKWYFILSLFLLFFCIGSKSVVELQIEFYILRYFYMFLAPACIILPSIYLFSKTPEHKHYMISACIALATIFGLTAAYLLKHINEPYLNYWPVLPVLTTGIAYLFYKYICDTSDYIPTKQTTTNDSVFFKNKVLGLLLGSACCTAITFHSLLLNDYAMNVLIINNSNFDFSGSTYFFELALFILPCAKICEKFTAKKTILISLSSMFFLSMTFALPYFSCTSYAIHQILFAFFSALLIAPLLKILNELFMGKIFDIMFWVTAGFSLCVIIAEFAGLIFHTISLGLGLLGFFSVNYFGGNTNEPKKPDSDS